MTEAELFFKKSFGFYPTHTVRAPGRLELLGNHTDYNEGLVLSLAVDKYVSIASAVRFDGKIELVSSAFPGRELFSLSSIKPNPRVPWADYVKGVLAQMLKREVHFSGFTAAIHSTIPPGAGLSSSAAVEVASALAIRKMYPYMLTLSGQRSVPRRAGKKNQPPEISFEEKMALAKLCQAAENAFIGVKCGLLDQISSLFGRAHHAMEIDFKNLTVAHAPFVGDFQVVVCGSGVKHQLLEGKYNELRENCETAARVIGTKSLRSVDLSDLKANRSRLTRRQYECAYHVIGENQRVIFGERALRDHDITQFGQYMLQSHESSRDFLRNSAPELDLLVKLARAHPACLGARLTGGGFGGATINLVKREQAKTFMQIMAALYPKFTGRPLESMVCQIVDGAR